jgi:hypothetical protein
VWLWLVRNPAWAIAGVLVLACGLLFGLERYRAAKLDAARAELQVSQANAEAAIAANRSLSDGLARLKAAHDTLIATVRSDSAAIERAVGALKNETQALRANSGRLRATREEIFRATPSCAELASIDLAAACPALARSLRREADRQRSSSLGDPGAGSDGASF